MSKQNTQWQIYRQLNQIPENIAQTFLQRLIAQLKQITKKSIQRPTTSEPIIRQARDRNGQIWWYVYDAVTGRSASLISEEEVLVWLEERFSYRQRGSDWNNASIYRLQWLR